MKKHIYDEKNGLYYTLHGDIYLPDLVYSKNNYPPLGKYGMLRNFDAFYGNTNFSRKWLSKMPKEIITREYHRDISRIRIKDC